MIKAGETITAPWLRRLLAIVILAALHSWALAVMILSEPDLVGKAAFLFAWGVLNALWLLLLRRPAASAALAVTMLMVLIALSAFKHEVLFMTVSFTDVLVVDTDTLWFLFDTFTDLGWYATSRCAHRGAAAGRDLLARSASGPIADRAGRTDCLFRPAGWIVIRGSARPRGRVHP